jgi:hypothetical protein
MSDFFIYGTKVGKIIERPRGSVKNMSFLILSIRLKVSKPMLGR